MDKGFIDDLKKALERIERNKIKRSLHELEKRISLQQAGLEIYNHSK